MSSSGVGAGGDGGDGAAAVLGASIDVLVDRTHGGGDTGVSTLKTAPRYVVWAVGFTSTSIFLVNFSRKCIADSRPLRRSVHGVAHH
jgi:hypothetical protein